MIKSVKIKSVNKIGEGFTPEPFHHPNGFIKFGDKVPVNGDMAEGCKKARSMLAPPMERLLKEKEWPAINDRRRFIF